MLTVSNDIKNAYNQYTTQRKSYIQVGNNQYFIQNMDLYADAYDEGNVVGNAISKILKFDIETQYVRGLDEFTLYDGIWTGEQYEYINLGTFKLFEEQGTDDFFSSITSYDKLILFNKPYNPELTTYPTTVYGLLQNICSQAGVTLSTGTIANGSKILEKNLFVEGETLKDILKAICEISGNFCLISNDELKLKLKGTDTLTLQNYQISDPEYKRTTWKINQVVLGMKDVEGEYVLEQDDEDIERNGVHKIVINNNPFVYTQALRQEYIHELFLQLKGFGYIAYETKWEGLPYVELGDLANINDKETMVLRYELKSPDGLESMLAAPSIIDSVIDYTENTDTIENRLKRTEYAVKKDEQIIESIISLTTEQGEKITRAEQNIDGFIFSLENKGISNVLYGTSFQTGFYKWGKSFENEESEIKNSKGFEITDDSDTVSGKALISKNESSPFESYLCSDFNKVLSNTEYTFNCKYNDVGTIYIYEFAEESDEIILNNATNKIEINNGEELPHTFTTLETTEYIVILFENLTTSGEMVVADIMLNLGNTSIEWSQNRNEFYNGKVSINENGITTYINEENYSNMDGLDFNQVINNETTFSTANGKVYSKNLEWEETFKKGGKFLTRVLDDGIADFWIGGE